MSTTVVQGHFHRVLVKIEADEGNTGLGEAYRGVGIAEVITSENLHNIGNL